MLIWSLFTIPQIKIDLERQPDGFAVVISGEDGSNITQNDILQSGPYESYISLQLNGNFDEIKSEAFCLCKKLQKAILTNVKFIRYGAFSHIQLTEINYGNQLELVESYGTSYLVCTSIVLPKTLKTINSRAFEFSGFKKIEFEANGCLTFIGVAAFDSVPITEIINFPLTCETMNFDAWMGTKITSFALPPSLKYFAGAFRDLSITITLVDPVNSRFVINSDGLIYSKDFKTLFYYPKGLSTANLHQNCIEIEPYVFSKTAISSIQLPTVMTIFNVELFKECKSISTLVFPEELLLIKVRCFQGSTISGIISLPDKLHTIEATVFSECSGITKMAVTDSNQFFSTDLIGVLYDKAQTTIIWFPPNVYDYVMPDTITSVNEYMFSQYHLKSIVLSKKLYAIYDFSFNFNDFTSLFIPKSCVHIGNIVFSGCPYLKTIEFEEGSLCKYFGNWCFSGATESFIFLGAFSLETVGLGCFQNNIFLKRFDFPPSMALIANNAFSSCTGLQEITFSSEVKIGTNAFLNCSSLHTLKANLETIGVQAFAQSGVRTVIFTSKTKTINSGAFSKCASLNSVIFEAGNAIESIYPLAFGNCNNLESITIPSSIKNITASSFGYCQKLVYIEIVDDANALFKDIGGVVYTSSSPKTLIAFPSGKSVADIDSHTIILGPQAFDSCGTLSSVHFNPELKEISNHCFSNCVSLKSINIPKEIKRIGTSPFDGCNLLSVVFFCGTTDDPIIKGTGEIIPIQCNVYVNSFYQDEDNQFLGHSVIKSYSIDPDGCPNIPSNEFTRKKARNSRQMKIMMFTIMQFLFKPKQD